MQPDVLESMSQPAAQPQPQPTAQEVIAYNRNIVREESRLRMMMRQFMNSQYMPTRDQMVQILTTVLTLVLMMALGPMMGNSSAVQSVVKQVVPLIVAAAVHFTADQTMPLKPIEAPITDVALEPVTVAPSQLGQTI